MQKMAKNMHMGGEIYVFWRLFAISGAIDYWKLWQK
jgi:hypothetical protein